MSDSDIYIKQEEYPDCRLHGSIKAMEWAHANGYENSLTYFGKKYCGRPVWYPGMTDEKSAYSFAIRKSHVRTFIRNAEKAGLTVQSEY